MSRENGTEKINQKHHEKPFTKIDELRAKKHSYASSIDTQRNKKLPVSDSLARKFTEFAGSNVALMMAAGIIAVWVCTGPVFKYSDTWQLVINTGTTIITFLMVFIIQRAQNKDSIAIHLKLNELVASLEGASNRLIDCEDLSEKELRLLEKHYQALADRSCAEDDITRAHSIEEAQREIQKEIKDMESGKKVVK